MPPRPLNLGPCWIRLDRDVQQSIVPIGRARMKLSPSDSEAEGSGTGIVHMDSALWSRLPEDCVDRVLARLPLPSMFRLRSVCKRWCSFIVSEAFFTLQSEMSANRACFLLCTHGRVSCIFNFTLDGWHFVRVPRIILPITVPPVSVTAASGSLLCYANQVAECSTLYVCNPFTKSLRELPPMRRVRLIHKLSIVADADSRSYQIMVSGEDGAAGQMLNPHVYKLYTELYDSRTGIWDMGSCPPADAKFGSDPGVWLDKVFYCITELPYGVVAFDLRTKSWCDVKAEMPPMLGSPSLVACGKRQKKLMMVGRVRRPSSSKPGNVGATLSSPSGDMLKVWELSSDEESQQQQQHHWVEVHALPQQMRGEFLETLKPRTPLVCSGVGHLVCITSHLSPRPMVLDVSTGEWRWLPVDPLFPRQRNFHLMGFCFEPRLDLQP